MRNNEKLKNFITKIGVDRTLQCLIEMLDDSIVNEHSIPNWKLRVVDFLEQAYDVYMTKDKDSLYENA